MACPIDWSSLLEKKYPSYKIEVNAFLNSLDVANSIEVSTQIIYEAICDDEIVNPNLKMLYKEAIFGSNYDVKNRIKNRVGNFKRALKGHLKIQNLEMMHASDFSQMDVNKIKKTIDVNKKKDLAHAKALQDEIDRRKISSGEGKSADSDAFKVKNVTGNMEKRKASTIEDSPNAKDNDKGEDVLFLGETSGEAKSTDAKRFKPTENAAMRGKEWRRLIEIETGDVIFNEIDGDGDDGIEQTKDFNIDFSNLKTYGNKKINQPKKKLMMKKAVETEAKPKSPEKENDVSGTENDEIKKNQMKDLAEAFKESSNAQSSQRREEAEIFKKIKMCTDSVQKSSVEQTATMRAWCAKNDLDVEKYRKQVEQELQVQNQKDGEEDKECTERRGPLFPPPEDEDALIPLPDFDDDPDNDHFQGHLHLDDDYNTDSSEMHPDETPFYANQEDDPEVQRLMLDEAFKFDL